MYGTAWSEALTSRRASLSNLDIIGCRGNHAPPPPPPPPRLASLVALVGLHRIQLKIRRATSNLQHTAATVNNRHSRVDFQFHTDCRLESIAKEYTAFSVVTFSRDLLAVFTASRAVFTGRVRE